MEPTLHPYQSIFFCFSQFFSVHLVRQEIIPIMKAAITHKSNVTGTTASLFNFREWSSEKSFTESRKCRRDQ